MKTLFVALVASAVMAAGGPAPAAAQPLVPVQDPPPQPMAPPGDMTPGEIQKLFDAYMVMEAQEALALNEQQYPQFLTRLRALQETRRRNQQLRNQLMQQLQRLTNPRVQQAPDENVIKERLAALHDLETRSADEMRRAYASIDEVLDVRQQARFRVLEEQLERRKVELLTRARQQNRQNQQPNAPQRRPPGW
jgi:hypothetical protein